ncbi:MAG: ABC transporter ATP-binding protein [Acidobacteriota bacterium]
MILDEPVSSLDLSVQAQILALIADLRSMHELAIVLISHDIGVVRHACERLAVMREGSFIEFGRTKDILNSPSHPYTRALLDATSAPGRRGGRPNVDLME